MVMVSKQKSISIDSKQEVEINRYMKQEGIKYFSGAVFHLIHRGLSCKCRNGNKGGGVTKRQNASNATNGIKEIPICLGEPGKGACDICEYSESCAVRYSEHLVKIDQYIKGEL